MPRPQIIDLINTLPRSKANEAKWLRKRALSVIRNKIVHWNGPPVSSDPMRQLVGDANYHIEKDWNAGKGVFGWGLMYHFAVDRFGKVYATQPLEDITWHVSDGNLESLAIICVLGEGQKPTPEMLASLNQLCEWLDTERPDLPNVRRGGTWGHGECGGVYGGGPNYHNNTSCPGPDLLKWVRAYRTAAPNPPAPPVPAGDHLFSETNIVVKADFYKLWEQRGGVARDGLPVRPEKPGKGVLEGLVVQYFERTRYERHSDGTVTFGRVGAELADIVDPLP